MENETINVKGNFAAKVGKMWAQKEYNGISLSEQPKSLTSFKEANELAQETGGRVWMFKPVELTDEQIADLKLAAASAEE